jgi:hypothetical protein
MYKVRMSRTRNSVPAPDSPGANLTAQAQGPTRDLALQTLGWKAFQDLCAQICEEVLKQNVSIYREAQDGGQDAVLLIRSGQSKGLGHTGTVQCKFTSDSKRRLKPSDLAEEKKSISELVAKQQAYSYYFITNMSVDAPVAAAIREELRSLGIIEAEVLGREWITMKIRESARLRALVPRVYGLGDLSIILDERRAEQTRALLGHLLPTLGVYVPTAAHRQAVRLLGEYGIVLLLGAPATGKSTLAAILATTALDGDNHRCFQVDGPSELMTYWNPHEPGGFYWIDDAFGPSQLRDDYVDQWIAMMNKLKAAISAGNRFVLTSRSHIWLAAKNKLATRNHPRFADSSAIVDVGALSPEERSQVLYNHIKAGNQSVAWKLEVKPYLAEVAKETNLLPEIARRLGDRSYTNGIIRLPDDLKRFVAEPLEFLKSTIGELSDAHRAALTIVFLHRSRLPDNLRDDERWALVGDKFGVSQVEIGDALNELNGSFLIHKSDSSKTWTFFHPTIADALSAILGQRPDLVELYVRGTRVEALLSEAVCAGAETIRDAVVVPDSINDLLISRLLEIPDEQGLNRKLFTFLAERASEAVLRGVLKQDQSLLSRHVSSNWQLYSDPTIRLYARVHALGQLPTGLRNEAVERLEQAIVNDLDGSFLDEDDILALFPPTRLLSLSVRICGDLLDLLPARITGIADEANLDIEPEDNFDEVRSLVRTIKSVFADSAQVQERIADIERNLSTATNKVSEKRRDFSEQWIGEDVTPSRVTGPTGGRPLFSDVDA